MPASFDFSQLRVVEKLPLSQIYFLVQLKTQCHSVTENLVFGSSRRGESTKRNKINWLAKVFICSHVVELKENLIAM